MEKPRQSANEDSKSPVHKLISAKRVGVLSIVGLGLLAAYFYEGGDKEAKSPTMAEQTTEESSHDPVAILTEKLNQETDEKRREYLKRPIEKNDTEDDWLINAAESDETMKSLLYLAKLLLLYNQENCTEDIDWGDITECPSSAVDAVARLIIRNTIQTHELTDLRHFSEIDDREGVVREANKLIELSSLREHIRFVYEEGYIKNGYTPEDSFFISNKEDLEEGLPENIVRGITKQQIDSVINELIEYGVVDLNDPEFKRIIAMLQDTLVELTEKLNVLLDLLSPDITDMDMEKASENL